MDRAGTDSLAPERVEGMGSIRMSLDAPQKCSNPAATVEWFRLDRSGLQSLVRAPPPEHQGPLGQGWYTPKGGEPWPGDESPFRGRAITIDVRMFNQVFNRRGSQGALLSSLMRACGERHARSSLSCGKGVPRAPVCSSMVRAGSHIVGGLEREVVGPMGSTCTGSGGMNGF